MTDAELDTIYHKALKQVAPPSMTKEQKWLLLRKFFGPECEDREYCWWNKVAEGPADEACSVLTRAYVPEGPWNSAAWWSGLHIDNLFLQYEDKYKDFIWLGVHPIDFKYASDIRYYGDEGKIRETDLVEAYRDGKRRMATILNLDTHDKSGSHWVSCFIDLTPAGTREDPYSIEYFDSVGNSPRRKIPPEVLDFVNTLAIIILLGLGKFSRFSYNGIQHQGKDTECGSYSCYFVHQRLSGVPFEKHCQDVVSDARIKKVRNVFLRPEA